MRGSSYAYAYITLENRLRPGSSGAGSRGDGQAPGIGEREADHAPRLYKIAHSELINEIRTPGIQIRDASLSAFPPKYLMTDGVYQDYGDDHTEQKCRCCWHWISMRLECL